MVEPGSRLQIAPFGAAATSALRAAITAAKHGDALTPVTVVMPSALAALTQRRALARVGSIATEFVTLPALVPRLASGPLASLGKRPIGSLEARLRVRAILAREGVQLAELAHHPATLAALVETFREMRTLADGELTALAKQSERAAEVVDLHRSFRSDLTDRSDDHDALVAATDAVRGGDAVLNEIGRVVVFLPRRSGRAELDLFRALAERGQLTVIAADDAIAADFRAFLDADAELDTSTPAPLRADVRLLRAPDPAEEAKLAVRVALDQLRAGTPADRIAIVSRVASPYSLLVHEELTAAGIVHSAPAPMRLAQSVAGRALLGLLHWPMHGHRRDELMRLLRSAPIRDPAGGTTRPDRWDRIARNAGVVGGLEQWTRRLEEAKRERLERLTAPLVDVTPTLPLEGEGHGRDVPDVAARIAEIDALAAFVARLAAATDAGARRGWRSLSVWAENLLRTLLGTDAVIASWSDDDQRAHAAVVDLFHELAELDGIGPAPDLDAFVRLVAHELDRPSARAGRFGHGVFVGRLVDAVGADLDLVVVLGASEGSFPPRQRDDPLLSERERAAAGGALRPRGSTVDEEERDIRAVLASATNVVITHPAADPRNQREAQPAAFITHLVGPHVEVESFEWWLGHGRPPATSAEFDIAALLHARAAGVPVGQLPLVRAAGLERGLVAATARARGELGPWSGLVGHFPELADDLDHPRSPTGLQQWAACPFSYFLERVLGLRELEDPGEAETITAMDRGTLVHAVLERFFRLRLGRRHDAVWTADDHDELLAIADEFESVFRERGLTGRPLLWQAEWQALRRHLRKILEADARDPRLEGVSPAEVELAFGFEGEPTPPVQIDLGGGRRLNFGGRVDRIDQSPDGRKLVVLDYKTGSARDYGVIDAEHPTHDIVARGRLLQLPIYALAARAQFAEADEVEAYYWFVGQRGTIEMKGGPIDDAATERFESVVRTIVDGIESGVFPARPGDDDWRPGTGPTHANCKYCAFDRLCSSTRAEQWLSIRTRDEVHEYVELAEP